tara:strand:- start:94 stop:237 length:144 start_codon:yes stop_codon:yes gene_type:complete
MGQSQSEQLLPWLQEARQGSEVRRMKKMIPVRGMNPALGGMMRRMRR